MGLYTLRALAQIIANPMLLLVIISLAVVFYKKNLRISMIQKMVIGESLSSPLELTASQIVIGIFAGIGGSLTLTYLGVIFYEHSGIEFMFLISIILTVWKPRFICFSYSGAILGIISIFINDVYGYGQYVGGKYINVDITSLVTLIGVLHVVEGIMVAIDGSRGSVPVFTERKEKIIGGFSLKRFWPMPIAFFIMVNINDNASKIIMHTPNWWPIIKGSYTAEFLATAVLVAIPLYAIIGYNAVTFTRSKTKKALNSGLLIFLYGVIIVFLAQFAVKGIIFRLIIVAIMPILHECMLIGQSILEEKGKPLYVSSDDGIAVLEVAPSSEAYKKGIRSGDMLLEINNEKITSEKDIINYIKPPINYMDLKIRKTNGEEKIINFTNLKSKRMGLENDFKSVLENIKDKIDKDKDDL
jgi:hypothetical protein